MLNENIKTLRQAKGLSQKELAIKLNVVRQTVSKWEKGLSVPDAEMLIRIADALDTSVNTLLGDINGEESADQDSQKSISAILQLLNEHYAKQNDRHRKTWRTIFTIILALASFRLLRYLTFFMLVHLSMGSAPTTQTSIIIGADMPAYRTVLSFCMTRIPVLITILVVVVSSLGIYHTRKK